MSARRAILTVCATLLTIAASARAQNTYTDNFAGTGSLSAPWTAAYSGGTLPTKNNGTVTASASGYTFYYSGTYTNIQSVSFIYQSGIYPDLQSRVADGQQYIWDVINGAVIKTTTTGGFSATVVSGCPSPSAGDTLKLSQSGSGVLTCADITQNLSSSSADGAPLSGGYPGFYVNTANGTLTGPATMSSDYGLGVSPMTLIKGSTNNTLTLMGQGTTWTAGTPGSPTFTLSGGSGASIVSQSVQSAIAATLVVNAGNANGTLTITDPSTNKTTSLQVVTPQTWFIRPKGGTRYSANVPNGQCDGLGDVDYPGSGTNQHCGFNDVRYMWSDGTYANYNWVMQGGDTLVIHGCSALPDQQNRDPDQTHCRIGLDNDGSTTTSGSFWGSGITYFEIPALPSGVASQHTRILGDCAYGTYRCNPVNVYPYTSNLTQLFGGFHVGNMLHLEGVKNVDIEGIELTSHNGVCQRFGATNPLPGCNVGSPPYSDAVNAAISTDNTTSTIYLQDVYIHGVAHDGIFGPIGGPIKTLRTIIAFNAFAGWNMDNGRADASTPNGPGSSMDQTQMIGIGNGCVEEYPIVHKQFPARSCQDLNGQGFGDFWSGQASGMDSFSCDQCFVLYNVKDGALGPHTVLGNLKLTRSVWAGNMGQAGKWGVADGGTSLIQNNILLGNCFRLGTQMPGSLQNFDYSTGLSGSGLSLYCRANGPLFDFNVGANGTALFDHNTVVTYQPVIFENNCTNDVDCSSTPITYTNNLVYGITAGYSSRPPLTAGQPPALNYVESRSDGTAARVTYAGSNNVFFGIKSDYGLCGNNGNNCTANPGLVGGNVGAAPPETITDLLHYALASGGYSVGKGGSSSRSTDFTGRPATNDLGALSLNSDYVVPTTQGSAPLIQQIVGYIWGKVQ